MAKYRWGFEEEGIFTECHPIVDNDTALEFTQESGQIFYRAKLNGSLAFRFEFDDILAKGYNYTHIVVLQWYDNSDNTWKECWRGHFSLTDCEIDYDTNTVSVQPETQDRYTEILENYESEYNLVKLSAKMQPVNILIRPCTQIYLAGNTRISCYVGGNSWDADCETAVPTQLYVGNWEQLRNCAWLYFTYTSGQYAGKYAVYYGRFIMADLPGDLYDVSFPLDGRVYNSDGTYVEETLQGRLHHTGIETKWTFEITDSGNNEIMTIWYNLLGDDYGDNYWNYQEGSSIENGYFRWDRFYGRTICQSDLTSVNIGGTAYDLYDIADMDIAGNYNYNKFIKYVAAETYPSINTSEDPTGWPESGNGRYFIKPANTSTRKYFPIAVETWNSVSYWFYASSTMSTVESLLIATRTIRDSYELRNTVLRLLGKANWQGTYFISGILGGSQDYAGFRFLPVITAKSNVISSYYDTPAQNAPISLSKIFSMLKQAYRIYWYIDENDNIHVEHISYFDNGNSYTETEPEILIDLESQLHTRTSESKVYGQNKVKFEKTDMPQQFTFAWMDKQTMAFDGFPINCLDAYVNKGSKEDNIVGDFDTDIDYILTAPNEVSKDGFVLFALPFHNGAYRPTLRIEVVRITDENGDEYELKIQNAEGAFAKIHENMWRYDLPCENVNINNEDTTAITVGRYKLQSVEFADEAMAEILKDISKCMYPIRTQQGDGHIKTLSINLNSYAAKADLLFNFVGRWYYLRGTALQGDMTITLNGESITISVGADNKFIVKYKDPISELSFAGTDVVSVNFADCDNLNDLTSADNMFKNCAELIAVDFANKTFAAVTSAEDMFAGASALTTLICPATNTWKPDIDFTDCPNLTVESLDDFIVDYLYQYDSGVHTITPNGSMWNNLDGATQDDLIAKATAKGWQIAIPAQYSVSGTSSGSTVYATINGNAVEIAVVGGAWSYDYNTPISSIAFTNDTNLLTVDFSASDLLASLTSLNDAFKGCAALTSVDFTNCDLTNVASASDCFANCAALTNLTIPTGTWKPDVDFSTCPLIVYAEMQDIIGGLYTYSVGTHTITWNTTYWDSLSVAQQQTIYDAADAKGWETNAVAVVYYIRGTSSNVNGQETFNVTFINNGSLTPSAEEQVTANVDSSGNWEFSYVGKRLYQIKENFFVTKANILSVEFTDTLDECITFYGANYSAFRQCGNLEHVIFAPNTKINWHKFDSFFYDDRKLISVNFENCTFMQPISNCGGMFYNCRALTSISIDHADFSQVIGTALMFSWCMAITSIDLHSQTFASVTDVCTNQYGMFNDCSNLVSVDLRSATFANTTRIGGNGTIYHGMFANCSKLQTIRLDAATFASVTSVGLFVRNCSQLSTFVVTEQNTAIASDDISFQYSPLTYTYMLAIANWLKDLTNLTAKTVTFKSTAWSALSSAEQATIQGILQGKNWNLATA